MNQDDPSVFDNNAIDYDHWYDRHPILFHNEYTALGKAIPANGVGLEIGTGTGRFTKKLNIGVGVEPSPALAKIAHEKGVVVINAKAESLPFRSQSFDYAVMITADCFLNNIPKAFAEAHRVIKNNGCFIVAMIDKKSAAGIQYETRAATSRWYKDAHFHTVPEMTTMMEQAGFTNFEYWQTLFTNKEEIAEPLPGFGKGSFVVIKAGKFQKPTTGYSR